MARQQNNSVMYGTKGLFNKQVVFKKRMGIDYVAGPPTKNPDRVATENQKAQQARFRRHINYVKKVIASDELKAIYAAGAKAGQTAANAAFQDASKAPEILNVSTALYTGVVGNNIPIQAIDNFKVIKLTVSITNPVGELIEEGEATDLSDGLNWDYVTKQVNPNPAGSAITVEAFDLAGNATSLKVNV